MFLTMPREGATLLSDIRVPVLFVVCASPGASGTTWRG
jgi:hypothetical protein